MASRSQDADPDEEETERDALLAESQVEGEEAATENVAATNGPSVPNGQEQSSAAAAETPAQPPPAQVAEVSAAQQAERAAEEEAAKILTIFTMARQQSFLGVTTQLEKNPQHWTACDEDGHTLLHWASLVGNADFVQLALSKKCPVDAKANNMQTPLMWAVLRGHLPAARALLDAKAEIRHHDSLGATPLMIAVQHKNYESLLLLMHRGGEDLLRDGDKNGCTPAHWASYKGDLTALKFLHYFGANLQEVDNAGMLPIHRATCANEAMTIEFLAEKKADLTARNKEGKTCLEVAEAQQSERIAALLRRLMKKDDSFGGDKKVADVEQGASDKDAAGGSKKEKKDSFFQSLTKDKAAQKMFPVFWLVCVSMALFEYIMDLRQSSYEAAPTAALLFELGAPLSVAIFFYVALSDPGMLPTRPKGNSGVEELMRSLDSGVASAQKDISRLCTTTWVLKDLRTKYCSEMGGCIEEFDHYCVWLNTSIGKKNHRQFYCLALVEWCTQVIHIYLLWCMSCHLVPYTSFGSWLYGVVAGYPLLMLIALVQCLTVPWILMLLYQQGKLIARNMTTNEMMNLHRYEHFWVAAMTQPGRVSKMFHNPFDKGGNLKNCFDFWYARRRSIVSGRKPEIRPEAHEHGGGHGGHAHGGEGHIHGAG